MVRSANDMRWKVATSSGSDVRPLWQKLGSTRVSADEWWAEAASVPIGDHKPMTSPDAWLGLAMMKRALAGGPAVHTGRFSGNLIVPPKHLIDALSTVAAVRPIRYAHEDKNVNVLYSGDHTMIHFETFGDAREGRISVATIDEDVIRRIAHLARGVLYPDDPSQGLVFGLAKGMNGYYLTKVGIAGQSLERGNYEDAVLHQYDHVVADLCVPAPCGRLSIFSGVPGSGKTFMVRALLKDVPHAAFVLVPSYLIKDLGSPEILPTLANLKNDGFRGPIALILEDADQALVKRTDGDIAAISSLLNLGDGILGNVLDIRIIATTNAAKLEMDPATRRPGRLCSYIEINYLSIPKASAVLERLTGKKLTPRRAMTIAECYSAARKFGWQPPKVEPVSNLRFDILGLDAKPSP